MREIKMTKVSDEDNVLGFNQIVIIDRVLLRIRSGIYVACEHLQQTAQFYDYGYLAICDGVLETIDEDDLVSISHAYITE